MANNPLPAGAAEAPPGLDQAREWLDCIEPRPQDRRAKVAFALFEGWGDAAEPLFFEWLRRHPEHDAERERGGRDTWRSARKRGPTTWRTLRGLAWDAGWRPDPTAPRPPPPTPAELARQQAERERRDAADAAERQAQADAAAADARQRLANADLPDPQRGYLRRKGLTLPPDTDLRQEGTTLLVPVTLPDGVVRGLQLIPADGSKLFSRGTRPAGCLWWARPPADEAAPPLIVIVEGVADALTVAAAVTDAAVACAWSAGNLPAVAQALRQRYPAADVVIAADADEAGRKGAAKAAAETGARVVSPRFPAGASIDGKAPTDFDDLRRLAGIEAVRSQLMGLPDDANHADQTAAPPAAPVAAQPVIDAPDDDGAADAPKGGRRPSALDLVLALTADLTLFHTPDDTGYFAAEYEGRREIWPIQSRAGRDLVQRRYLASTRRGLPAQTLKDALDTLDALARHEGKRRDVFLRVARFPDRVLIDLADERWRVLEVTARGWRVLDRSPVPFVRRAGMAPLPEPQRGGSVDELRTFVNVSDANLRLVVGWMLAALGGRGPFPVLVLQAEQGAGKSTAGRVLRALVDPADVPLKAPPSKADDWAIAASVSYVLALDNLSGLSNEQSDILCRLATGAGLSKRRLYSDLDEIQLHLCRPVLLNGIDAIATRPDLADRSLVVTLPTIPTARRRREGIFWAAFDAARPRLLGALLDAVAGALQCSGNAPPPELPRMADFAAWVCAAEPALGWPAGAFLAAYHANIQGAAEASVEASPVGVAVLALLNRNPSVTYIASELMPVLENAAPVWAQRPPAWPRSPRGLTDSLRRLTAPLRQLGIEVSEHRDANGRWITLQRRPQAHPNATIDEVIF